MAESRILQTMVQQLEAQQRDGEDWVYITPANREFLKELLRRSKDCQTRPAQPPPPHPKPTYRSAPAPAPAVREQPDLYEQPAPTLDLSQAGWEDLDRLVPPCNRCELGKLGRRQTVMEDGDRQADLMFIGEGPGADEDREGVAFVGEAGKLLTRIIEAMGFQRGEVYIANIVKCRPPRNRNPEPEEAAACLPYLKRQIELVQPKVIVLLGAVPLLYLMDVRGITRNHGRWMKYGDIDVMPTFHPAFLKRKPEAKRDVWEDMQKVMAKFGKTPPGRANRSQ